MWSVFMQDYLPTFYTRDGQYKLEVIKPYPEVKDGQFRTNLYFYFWPRPENIRARQTYHIQFTVGDPSQAILVPRGGFSRHRWSMDVYLLMK